jgi:hypothetical protein
MTALEPTLKKLAAAAIFIRGGKRSEQSCWD